MYDGYRLWNYFSGMSPRGIELGLKSYDKLNGTNYSQMFRENINGFKRMSTERYDNIPAYNNPSDRSN